MSRIVAKQSYLAVSLVLIAAFSRLIPHPPDFTAVMGMSIFAGTAFRKNWQVLFLPVFAMALSDVFLGFYSGAWIVYGTLAVIALVSKIAVQDDKVNLVRIGTLSVAAPIFHFAVTNLGVWEFDHLYPKTLTGLWTCYVAALPFFQNALASSILSVIGIFGVSRLFVESRNVAVIPK